MRDKCNLFLCFAFIHNVTKRVKGFRGNLRGPESLCQTPARNAKRDRSAEFDKFRNVFPLTYSHMIAQHFRQLNVYCFYLYFMKTGHELNCCVFISRECILEVAPEFEVNVG